MFKQSFFIKTVFYYNTQKPNYQPSLFRIFFQEDPFLWNTFLFAAYRMDRCTALYFLLKEVSFMSITAGQQAYLQELLSHEYTFTEEQQPAIRQAICCYATTAYTQQEIDWLISFPQSLLLYFYVPCGRKQFACHYRLWLNCLEHAIYREDSCLEAVCINPDPSSSQKLLALQKEEDGTYTAVPLPQLSYSKAAASNNSLSVSHWTWQETQLSFQGFLQTVSKKQPIAEPAESLTWVDLRQQAQLFSMVKESYSFSAFSDGIPRPSHWEQLQELLSTKPQTTKPKPKHCSQPHRWLQQPPVSPFAMGSHWMKQMQQTLSNSIPTSGRPSTLPPQIPSFPWLSKKSHRRP